MHRIIFKPLHIPGGAGLLPSTGCFKSFYFRNQEREESAEMFGHELAEPSYKLPFGMIYHTVYT